jgi:hypothetical protein
MRTTFYLVQLLIILLFQSVSAQNHKNKRFRHISQWEIGLSGGISTFTNSVNIDPGVTDNLVNYWYREANPGIGLSVTRNITPSLGIEINWLNTRLTGRWNNTYPPITIYAEQPVPLTFNSKINQLDLLMAFNLNKIYHPGNEKDKWHLFFKTGIGLVHIKDNQNFHPGAGPYIPLSFVADAGVSVSVNEKVKLMAGSSFRLVNTDNLDGVHIQGIDMIGNRVEYSRIFEIYNFTYLKMSYSWGQKLSKNTNRNKTNKRAKLRNFKWY